MKGGDRPIVEVRGLEFQYSPESRSLFHGINQRFHPGTVSVVTGASGQGKSTLLYLLGLLLTPTSGSIEFAGIDTRRLSDKKRSRLRATQIGFVFQDAALDPSRTVIDNVVEGAIFAGYGRAEAKQIAGSLLERLDVGLNAERRPGEVSGGQAQRVALCRALVKNPPVILADEPTGNLDKSNADVVLKHLIRAANWGAAVVIASHDSRVVEKADNVLAL